MTTLIEMVLLWLGNGIITASIVILNDRLFKKHMEKVFDKAEKILKDLGNVTKKE